jgi:hypothetical protein
MKKIVLFFISFVLISSCKKADLKWKLVRLSPKDAKLEVSDLIYSNNCSSLSGFQFIATGPGTPSSIYWDLTSNGFKGSCFKTQGNCTNASIKSNIYTNKDGILRFYLKTRGMPNESNTLPSVKINSKTINTAIILGNEDSNGEWLQLQTEILKAGNNEIEIKFSGSSIKTFYIDELELFIPLY